MDIQPLRTKNEDLLELERLLNDIGHLSDEIAKENVSVLPVSAKKKLWQISHNIELANSRLWSYCCYQDDKRWHHVSERPPVDKRGISKVYIVIDRYKLVYKAYFYSNEEKKLHYWVEARDWNMPEMVIDVDWWCEKPEEETGYEEPRPIQCGN